MAVNCSNCGGVMELNEAHRFFHCKFCGADQQPERSPDGLELLATPTGEICPACEGALERAAIGRFEVQSCPRCQGVLLEQRSLTAIRKALWERYAGPIASFGPALSSAGEDDRRCPHCQREMVMQPFLGGGNVKMNLCEVCNLLWLDRGELHRIVAGSASV